MTDPAQDREPATESAPSPTPPRTNLPLTACLRCGNPVASTGIERFRVGGTSGGWKLMFGEFAELGEDMIELEVLVCRVCRHVEFRLPPGGP